MKLDDEQIKTVLSWINDRWKTHECPVCSAQNWVISETVFEMREFNPKEFVVGAPVSPLVVLVCNNCGYSMAFNALKIGVVAQPIADVEEGSGSDG